MLNLNPTEKAWLDEYRRRLDEQFPGLVADILFFGPYARGVSDPDIDMCLLVLIKKGDQQIQRQVWELGFTSDLDGFFVAPSIRVGSYEEWNSGDPVVRNPFPQVSGAGVSAYA